MSHALGEAIKDGVVIGYFEYDGTFDVACTAIHPTTEGVERDWRTGRNCRECSCSLPQTDIILWTEYGDGFWWLSTACLNCMAITGNRDPWCCDGFPVDGHPSPGVGQEGGAS
jgi:hypothetical protein